MAEQEVILWELELINRLIDSGHGDFDLWDWASELSAEQDAIQTEFHRVGTVFGQLLQVEAGLRRLTQQYVESSKEIDFNGRIKILRSQLQPRFEDELLAIDRVRILRNHLAHGEVRVGVARMHSETPPEPVIALVNSTVNVPKSVDVDDPVRKVIESDLQPDELMKIATAGLEALVAIMIQTKFDPFSNISQK